MEETVRIVMEMGKKAAQDWMNGKNQEIVTRYGNAKFKAFTKCKVISNAEAGKTLSEQALSAIDGVAERNRKAISGISNVLKQNANSLAALSDTQKTIVSNMDKIFKDTKVLKSVAFLNTGLSVANLSVDIAGFVIISNKLIDMKNELNEKLDKVVNKDKNDLLQEYQERIIDFGFTAGRISNGEEVPFIEYEKQIKELRTYISKMIKNLVDGVMDVGLSLEIIYALLPAYSLIFNEYLKAYYIKNGKKIPNYEIMYQLYDELLSDEICQIVEDYYFLDKGKTSIEVIDIINMHRLMVLNDKIIANDILELLTSLETPENIKGFNEEIDKGVLAAAS